MPALAVSDGGACPERGGCVSSFIVMATLYETLRADIVTAMKARDNTTTTALRTADAAIKRAAMDANKEIDDALVIATKRKGVKELAESKAEVEKSRPP